RRHRRIDRQLGQPGRAKRSGCTPSGRGADGSGVGPEPWGRWSQGEVLVFVDADVAVQPEAVARIVDRFGADDGLAALFGSYVDDQPVPGLISRYKKLLHHHVHQNGRLDASTFWKAVAPSAAARSWPAAGSTPKPTPNPQSRISTWFRGVGSGDTISNWILGTSYLTRGRPFAAAGIRGFPLGASGA